MHPLKIRTIVLDEPFTHFLELKNCLVECPYIYEYRDFKNFANLKHRVSVHIGIKMIDENISIVSNIFGKFSL
jgi:hypothetical protein